MREKIGVCVIGSGRAGMIHARNFVNRIPTARLVAMVDPVEENVVKACNELEIKKYYLDYREALEDSTIDAIIVVTPTIFHKEIVVAAAKSKKHILCEKPMAMNAIECQEMIDAAKQHDVKLQIGFMRRYDSNFQLAMERINQGEIGDVVLVKSITRGPSVPQPWQYDIQASNGPLAEVNSHDIDTLRWFSESEIKHVYAIAGNFRCPEAQEKYPDFYDNVVMTVSFENGSQGHIDGAVSAKYGYDARTEVLGTHGVLFVGRLAESGVSVFNSNTGHTQSVVKSWRTLFLDAYLNEDQDFVDAILENRPPKVTGFDGKMAVKVVNAGNLSILEKRTINLEKEV